ncbi:MAG: AAA family ATPase, partial [Methylococcaceae bacterium]|nr:AAA family ATPase [Methylococcaceae bacterium]
MYKQYFHFAELPFSIAPDPHFIYMSHRHQEGLAHLLYGITVGGGFVALTGEVGTGKTTLCHCLLRELPDNIDIALILNPKLNAIELLATICDELGIAYDKHGQSLKSLVDALNHYLLAQHAAGRRTVLLLDEAQNLSMEVLEQIRLLTNLETSKTKLLQIILVGQPELKQMLRRQDLRQLNQRITARYHLLPLSLVETRAYVRHRLRVCGGEPDLFKDRAIRKIYKLSAGIPRIINILCDRALLGAYAGNAMHVTPGMVLNAAKETLAPAEKKLPRLGIAL